MKLTIDYLGSLQVSLHEGLDTLASIEQLLVTFSHYGKLNENLDHDLFGSNNTT